MPQSRALAPIAPRAHQLQSQQWPPSSLTSQHLQQLPKLQGKSQQTIRPTLRIRRQHRTLRLRWLRRKKLLAAVGAAVLALGLEAGLGVATLGLTRLVDPLPQRTLQRMLERVIKERATTSRLLP